MVHFRSLVVALAKKREIPGCLHVNRPLSTGGRPPPFAGWRHRGPSAPTFGFLSRRKPAKLIPAPSRPWS